MRTDADDADLASVARGEGVRDLVLTDRWDTPLGRPNGGYVLAAMLRGLEAEVGAGRPLVVSASYLCAPDAGPAQIRTSVLRRGRRISTGVASLVQDGRPTTHLTAGFGDPDPAAHQPVADLQRIAAPDLPPPAECIDPRTVVPGLGGIFDRVDHRLPPGPSALLGEPSGRLELAMWQRLASGAVPDGALLALLTDSFPPVVMERGARGSLTLQLTVHLHLAPVTPWVATRIATRHLRDGVHEQDCDLFGEDGTLLAQGRQLAMLA